MTDPEALVWAAAFAAAVVTGEAFRSGQSAFEFAHRAVHMLRTTRIRGRDENPAVKMLREFRMDDES